MDEKTPWQKYKEKMTDIPNEARPWHLLRKDLYIEKPVQESRYLECLNCEYLVPVTKQCSQCGCFMPAKTTLIHASCPIGKW